MSKKILWLAVSGLMVLSLVIAACGPAATPPSPAAPSTPITPTAPPTPAAPTASAAPTTEKPQQEAVKPVADTPKYGGTITLIPWGSEPSQWDGSSAHDLVQLPMWWGDWAKGPAGGYGNGEADWTEWPYNFDHYRGQLAESTKWTIDEAQNQGTIVYQIRQGVHWALNPKSEASRLVNGREVTADDVAAAFKRMTTDPTAYVYGASPELRPAQVAKTGPWEVTVKLPLDALVIGINRFGVGFSTKGKPVPPELLQKYGGNLDDWKLSVGPGPFMITDYVPGSVLTLDRNPNYWDKDPVGPGKGNQLPYLDTVKMLIIPDRSTQLAALRTGKLDRMDGIDWEEAPQLKRTTPQLLERTVQFGTGRTFVVNSQRTPFNDVKVRRALLMAIDLKTINQNLNGGLGQIRTFPWPNRKDFADLYLPDSELTESQKELYIYSPEKAKQLLKEAGYPNGFKTSVLMSTLDSADYMSIIKDMWRKVGVELVLDVKEVGTATTLRAAGNYDLTAQGGGNFVSIFYSPPVLTTRNPSWGNVQDPVLDKAFANIRKAIATDGMKAGMQKAREISGYIIDQAYHFPIPRVPTHTFWWPWLKNYSGEATVGYIGDNYVTWVWIDQDLKKSMGK